MLERAKGLRHRSVLFTDGDPMYIDKARRFPGRGLVIGADAFARLFEAKWGLDTTAVLTEMQQLGTTLLVFDRPLDGQLMTAKSVLEKAGQLDSPLVAAVVRPTGMVTPDISSTAVRAGQREASKQGEDDLGWKEPSQATTRREPLIVHVPTALSLVHDQVVSERKASESPAPSQEGKASC